MRTIIPSVFSTSSKEYVERYNKISKISRRIHLDVMDGKFVSSKSPSLSVLKNKGNGIDCHLMVDEPCRYIQDMKNLKVKTVFIHVEIDNLMQNIIEIKNSGFSIGLAINPETDIKKLEKYVEFTDSFLFMAVHPGKEGQKFILTTIRKVKKLREITDKEIFVDGGINSDIIKKFKGVRVGFISGSYISNSENPKKTIKLLSNMK